MVRFRCESLHKPALVTPNPSIDRTSQRLRPCAASHVKRWASEKGITLPNGYASRLDGVIDSILKIVLIAVNMIACGVSYAEQDRKLPRIGVVWF